VIKLGKFISTLEQEHTRFLLRPGESFPLPTETVIYKPQFVVPELARTYRTDLYLRGRYILSYDELRTWPGFRGTYHETEIWLFEVWTDRGSDGHVQWVQVGWRFAPSYCTGWRSRAWQGDLWPPEVMQKQIWEWYIQ